MMSISDTSEGLRLDPQQQQQMDLFAGFDSSTRSTSSSSWAPGLGRGRGAGRGRGMVRSTSASSGQNWPTGHLAAQLERSEAALVRAPLASWGYRFSDPRPSTIVAEASSSSTASSSTGSSSTASDSEDKSTIRDALIDLARF